MAESVKQSFDAGRQVVLLGGTIGMAERLRDILHEYEVPFRADFGDQPAKPVADTNAPLVGVGRLSAGFRLPDIGLEVFAETDILDETEHFVPSRRRKSSASTFLSGLQDLKPGNYVVHVDHGIGLYGGVTSIHDSECMVLTYLDDDRLYLPLERLDLIQKYSATEGSRPKLDRLGGTTWVQRKARVRKAIREMATELLRLYAERKVALGHAFPPDTEWQREFEEAFQYEETDDQLTSIADIKRDMEAETPMDRLVCGDVGYGKTEVAMRAAFKAVNDGETGGDTGSNDRALLPALRDAERTVRGFSGEHRDAQSLCSAEGTETGPPMASRPERWTWLSAPIVSCPKTLSFTTSAF